MRGAAALALALAAPAAAQQAEPTPAPVVRTLPTLAPRHPQLVRAERVKAVDIPQAAKDAGHNGNATYTATVGPDGKLTALVLKVSSMSPAIDEAVKARAEKLYYFPATDAAGNKIEGTVDVFIGYARHDSDSPGGGIETYTCGDLIREYDWFTAANAGRRKLFWPQNAYTSLTSVGQLLAGERPKPQERMAVRAKREKMWANLIKPCRKKPEKLMLSEVDQPEDYRRLVNSF
jgi:TonB family protein